MKNKSVLTKKIESLKNENNKLKKSVNELSDFLENAPMPLHWLDDNGIIIWANNAELNTFGYSREEYIGSAIQNYHVKKEVIFDILVRLKSNETIYECPADIKCKDGSVKHVLISTSVLIENGKFVHTRCFTRDVTTIIKEEKSKNNLLRRLAESETRLRLAIESTHLGTWDWDTSNNEIYISHEGRSIFGMPAKGRIQVSSIFENFVLENVDIFEKHKIELLDSGEKGNFDITQKIKKINDGTIRTIRIQGAIHTIKGSSPRFIGTVLDITDIDSAHENDARLAAIIRSSNDAIVGKTLDGIITYWNIAAERMFGFSEKEIIGASVLNIIPKDRYEEEDLILARMSEGESMEHFETKRLTQSGKIIDVSLTLSPIKDIDGKIIGISKIARDITEKKQEEKRKHDFVTMVSHEIKTPLTSILLNSQLLLKTFRHEQNNSTLTIGLKIEALTKKIISMVKDYLSVSRIEQGKMSTIKETFLLGPLISELIEDAKLVTKKHKIILDIRPEIYVFADRNKIEQVLINLLNNAIKYSHINGVIVIKCVNHANKVRVSIIDQGIGIKPEEQNKIFKRFYRINEDKASIVSGLGIGLYLVAEILKQHGSDIYVKSTEGKGSEFYFDLESPPYDL